MAAAKKDEAAAQAPAKKDQAAKDEATVEAADLPSVEEVKVTTNSEVNPTSDYDDPGKSWTVQSDEPYEEAEVKSEGAVPKEALPTKEGLAEAGVRDPETYLAGVVTKDENE